MKIVHYLFMILPLFFYACSEEEDSFCTVNIQLLPPKACPPMAYQEIKVTLTHKEQGTAYTSFCSSVGLVTLDVEYGVYTVSVYHHTATGLILSGRIESLPLLPEQGGIPATVPLLLSEVKGSALVIKEIYYGGCIGRLGETYQADQYVTLCNRSDETIYLDGLCAGMVDPSNSLESPWMAYTDMDRIPVNDLVWQFPGNSKDYPLLPGAETTIATNAVDHTGGEYQQPHSINLSKVDWGFWEETLDRQNIAPGVKPMKLILKVNPATWMYTLSVGGPAFMVFSLQGNLTEEYVNHPENREPRPGPSNPNRRYLMVPKEWVIDCIDCVEGMNQLTLKRVPNELDHGAAYIPEGVYSGKALIRKSTLAPNGRIVYQDTNNSTDDLRVVTPTLKDKL